MSWLVWRTAAWLGWIVSDYPWMWGSAGVLHFVGLALLVGASGVLNLRLLGFMKRLPVEALMDLMPWAVVGFAITLVTGLILVGGAPGRFLGSFAFNMKMLFTLAAGINVIYFRFFLWPKERRVGPAQNASTSAAVVAGVSLFCWMAISYFGLLLTKRNLRIPF